MKAIIFICILFASLLISSPSIAARELAETYKGPNVGTNPNKPAISTCGKPGNRQYSSCIRNPKRPIKSCSTYTRRNCKPPKGQP